MVSLEGFRAMNKFVLASVAAGVHLLLVTPGHAATFAFTPTFTSQIDNDQLSFTNSFKSVAPFDLSTVGSSRTISDFLTITSNDTHTSPLFGGTTSASDTFSVKFSFTSPSSAIGVVDGAGSEQLEFNLFGSLKYVDGTVKWNSSPSVLFADGSILRILLSDETFHDQTGLFGFDPANPNQSVGVDATFTLERGALIATPLPAALPLFAGGLGAMGLLGWRRKRKTPAPAAA
jgi:hypothetical protein